MPNFPDKHVFISAVDPTVNDDDANGFQQTHRWINTVTEGEYVCISAAAGAAVWHRLARGFQVVSTAIDYASVDHDIVLVDTASQAVAVTLPLALVDGHMHVKWTTSDTREKNKLTLTAQSGEFIDGQACQIYGEVEDSIELVSDGTNWFIL